MIGVGLIGFITIFASSTKASVNANIDKNFAGDIVVHASGGMMGGVDPALVGRLNALPQVAAATGVSNGAALVLGKVELISAVDPATAGKIFSVRPLQGSISDLGANGIAVYKRVAANKHLKLGDTVPVVFRDTGLRKMRVALIYGDKVAAPSSRYFMGTPAYNANFTAHFASEVFVQRAAGVTEASALAAVKQTAARYAPGADVLNQSQYKQQQAKPVNQLLALIYVLLALAVFIALLGIGNTLALSIYERTRELGVMRAVGMTRGQLRGTIRWESVIIALQGTVLGLLIGVFFGWALVLALRSKGLTVFSVPYSSLLVVVVLAAIAGVVAAIMPSRRAAKLNVLRAIAAE